MLEFPNKALLSFSECEGNVQCAAEAREFLVFSEIALSELLNSFKFSLRSVLLMTSRFTSFAALITLSKEFVTKTVSTCR